MNDPSIELGPPPFFGEHLVGPANDDDWDNFRARVDHWLSKARNIMRAEVEDYEIPILPVRTRIWFAPNYIILHYPI